MRFAVEIRASLVTAVPPDQLTTQVIGWERGRDARAPSDHLRLVHQAASVRESRGDPKDIGLQTGTSARLRAPRRLVNADPSPYYTHLFIFPLRELSSKQLSYHLIFAIHCQ